MPEFSVIVPIYNAERYVGRCIESILGQSFTDFELILVDDGSLDKSGQICEQYTLTDDRVCVVHQENGGVSKARNTGLMRAQGKFVVFIDSDDIVENNYLSCMAEVDKEIDLVICGVKNILPNGEELIKLQYDNKTIGYIEKESVLDAVENRAIDFVYAKRYKRSLIEKNGIYFDEQMNLGEDTYFVVNYLCVSNNIKYNMEIPYRYHSYEQDSLSVFKNDYVEKLTSMNRKALDVLEGRYEKISNTEIWKKRIFSVYHYSIFEILKNEKYTNRTKYQLLKEIVCRKEFKMFLPELDVYMRAESKIIRMIISTGSSEVILGFWILLNLKRCIE